MNGGNSKAQTLYDVAIPSTGSTTEVDFAALGVSLKINEDINDALAGGSTDYITASSSGSATFQLGPRPTATTSSTSPWTA